MLREFVSCLGFVQTNCSSFTIVEFSFVIRTFDVAIKPGVGGGGTPVNLGEGWAAKVRKP